MKSKRSLSGRTDEPGLADVGAEPLTERGVQQMGRGVVAHRRVARLVVDLGLDARRRAPIEPFEGSASKRLVVADPVDVERPAPLPHPSARTPESAT